MELAMACDIRIAADHARFGVVNRRWNVGAESGLTQRLPHIVGLGVALGLLITGRWFDAKEAYRINFGTKVVKAARLKDECTRLAEQICEYPQSSLRTGKEACIRGTGLTLEEGLRLENTLWNTNLSLPRRVTRSPSRAPPPATRRSRRTSRCRDASPRRACAPGGCRGAHCPAPRSYWPSRRCRRWPPCGPAGPPGASPPS